MSLYKIFCDSDANQCAAVWSAITAWAAIGAAGLAFIAFKSQISQSKADLWRSLSQEFDHTLGPTRHLCGLAFRGNGELDSGTAQKVLDFFETVGFLVRNGQIDATLAEHTFAHYFARYYKACENSIKEEPNPSTYADVKDLARRWKAHIARAPDSELKEFFDLEERFASVDTK
ncbi:MAG: hypothetical protein ABL955_01290 [Elusimicrobiota bacterium]